MNRVYKVIYNRARNLYQVVSEITHSRGKTKSLTAQHEHERLTAAVLIGLLAMSTSLPVGWADGDETDPSDTRDAAVEVKDGDTLQGGENITVTKDDDKKTIALGTKGLATTADLDKVQSQVTANASTIAANKSQIDAHTKSIGDNKTAIDKNTADIATNKTNIAKNATDIASLKEVNASLGLDKDKPGIKYFRTKADGADASATGNKSIAIGESAVASNEKAIALGTQAEASGTGAIAIGAETRENGNQRGAEAAAQNAVAIGSDAVVVGAAENGIALGRGAITGARSGMPADDGSQLVTVGGGKNSISVGNGANARGNSAIALGDGAVVMNDATADNTITKNGIAIGTGSRSVSENGTAIGAEAKVNGSSAGAMAIGHKANAAQSDSLAIGSQANASYADSVAIGTGAKAAYTEAVAIGKGTEADGNQAVALGSGTTAKADNVVSIGHGAAADAEYSVVIGEAAGTGMVGDKNHVNGSHVIIGKNAGQNVDGQEDISLGFNAGSDVKGNYNIAIGSGAGTYLGDHTNGSTQDSLDGKNVSLGYQANHYDAATAISEATALGANTKATTEGTAVGSLAEATGINGATAIGFKSLAEGEKSIALGEESIARGVGNVAIGGGSLATADMASGNAFLTGTTATQVVSVGNGKTISSNGLRRIVNVADGAADQDAVTVHQLKALQDNLNAQITNAHPGSSSGNAVTYSGEKNGYVNLKDDDGKAVQIKNVKDGVDQGDAVNKGQLERAVNDAKVHYYSVKTGDTATPKNNYNNDGAVGTDSLAMGVIAKATNVRSVAVGNNVTAESKGSIAMGVGYENVDGTMSETKAETGYLYNTAIGAGAQSAGNNSLAIGTRAAVKQKNGAASQSKESIAIGYLAETSDTRGVAMGAEAKSIAKGANAIGDSATTSGVDSVAIGTNATDTLSSNSIAIGTGANVQKGSSAAVIGNGSATQNAVNANVFGTGSSIANGKEDGKVYDNSLVGNENQIVRNDAQSVTNVTVSGNKNIVQGITDSSSAANASNLDKINITGTGNTVTLSDNTLPIEDVTIMGNDNKVEAALKYDRNGKPLSNIQILGSNVTATVGNSIYLGTGSAATAGATAETAGAGEYADPYGAAAGTADGVVTIGSKGKERRLQNLAAGLVSSTSTDAVNGSQLFLHTQPLRFAGDNSTIGSTASADQNVLHRGSDQAMTIKGGVSDTSKLSTDDNIGVIADTKDNTMTLRLSKDLQGISSISNETTQISLDDKTNTVNVNKARITNVAAGVAPTDAANVSQLATVSSNNQSVKVGTTTNANGSTNYDLSVDYNKVAESTALSYKANGGTAQTVTLKQGLDFTDGENTKASVGVDGVVRYDLNNDISLNSVKTGDTTINDNGLTIQGGPSVTKNGIDAGDKKITHVAAGDISETSTDAINGSQLYQVKQDVKASKTEVVAGSNVHVKSATGSNDQMIYTVSADKSVTSAGGSGLVTVTPTPSTDENSGAVTTTYAVDLSEEAKKQLAKEESVVPGSKNVVVTQPRTNATGGNEYKVDLARDIDVDTVTAGKSGADGKDGRVTVNGKDGSAVTLNGQDGSIGLHGKDGKNAITLKGADGQPGVNGAGGTKETRMAYETKDGTTAVTHEVATLDDGMKYGGDAGTVIKKKLNEQVNVVGGISDMSKLTADDNIGVVSDGSNNLKVRLSKDLKGLDTVTTKTITADTGNITTINATTINATTVNSNTIKAGDTVTINNQGADMGGTKVTHLKDGEVSPTSTDAVNGSQLYGTEVRVNQLNSRINRVGAGAAALAGLHPLDFDPDDKWDFAAGYGNYKDTNAIAVGAFYRSNEDTMFSIGGSFSGGENMVNAGISWKFGQKSHVSRSRVAVAKDVLALQQQVAVLTKELAAYKSGMGSNGNAPAKRDINFPDVPENHWAYTYVKSLADRGYLTGYPDGEFKGDRTMTRYEFAAIIYRALQNGAPSDGDMVRSMDEFEPEIAKAQEIDRFRVDRISGKDDDRHKVERVRVNDQDDASQNVHRDVYGSRIKK